MVLSIRPPAALAISIPRDGTILLSVRREDQEAIVPIARYFSEVGFDISLPHRAQRRWWQTPGITVERVNKVIQGRPHVVDKHQE